MKKFLICVLCLLMLAGCSDSKKDSNISDKGNENITLEENESKNNPIEEITEETKVSTEFYDFMCNTWIGDIWIGDAYVDQYLTARNSLTLNKDGTAELKFGFKDSSYIAFFNGTFTLENYILTLDLKGGQPVYDEYTDELISMPEEPFNGKFEIYVGLNRIITLTHIEGDYFYGSSENDIITFNPVEF